jgi:hypothetical protein
VESLARVRTLPTPGTHSVRFTIHGAVYNLVNEVAISARRFVASHLTPEMMSTFRRPFKSNSPDYSLMQQLFHAGIGTCPMSGVPVFNPEACTDVKRTAIWRVYCGVATCSKLKTAESVAEELAAVEALLQCVQDERNKDVIVE